MRFRGRFFTMAWLGLTGDSEIFLSTKPAKGYIVVDRGSRYPRKRLNFRKELLIERGLPRCVMVLQSREFESNRQKIVWIEPERFVPQSLKRFG